MFGPEIKTQPERNVGGITRLVTRVAVRLSECDQTGADTPRSFPDSANCFAFVPVEAVESVT